MLKGGFGGRNRLADDDGCGGMVICVPSSEGEGNHVLILDGDEAWCSCKGYQYRGRCRHSAVAAGNA